MFKFFLSYSFFYFCIDLNNNRRPEKCAFLFISNALMEQFAVNIHVECTMRVSSVPPVVIFANSCILIISNQCAVCLWVFIFCFMVPSVKCLIHMLIYTTDRFWLKMGHTVCEEEWGKVVGGKWWRVRVE